MIETITGSYTLKQILQDHWPAFMEKHGNQLRKAIIEEVDKVLHCRDPEHQGYHLYRCPVHPEVERVVPHSCKSRFCSSCGKVMTDNWMEKALGDFLNVPYHHLVFTIPRELRNIFVWNRDCLGLLFTAAKDTVLGWCRDKAAYIPGIVMVIHTFGCQINFNPHIHMLLTEGGLSPDRTKWVHNEFIPWSMLKERWKTLVIKTLRPRLKQMIENKQVGQDYLKLGTGQLFRQVLGLHLSEDLVCALGG